MRRWTAVCGKERAEPVRNHGVARCGAARVARVHTLGPRSVVVDCRCVITVCRRRLIATVALLPAGVEVRPRVAVRSWMSTFILCNIYNSSKLLTGAGSPAGPAQATPRSLWRARVNKPLGTLPAPQSDSSHTQLYSCVYRKNVLYSAIQHVFSVYTAV